MLDRATSLQYEQRYRIGLIAGAFGLLLFMLFLMLFERQVIQYRHFSTMAKEQHVNSQIVPAQRGKILVEDDDGELYPLATNVTLFALQVVPAQIERPELVATKLMPYLSGSGLEESELITKLSSKAKYLPPLKRKIEEKEAQEIADLDLTGVYLVSEQYRYYPEATMLAQGLGFVNRDGVGQYGLEGYFDKELGGEAGLLEAEQDVFGGQIALGKRENVDPEDGLDVVLTIDRAIQYQVEKALKASVEKHKAEKGSVIVMDPKTGKIIAMAAYPNFDPNSYNTSALELFTNMNTSQVYEPGSVFKVITMAAGIDAGLVAPGTTYTDTGSVEVNDRTIKNSDKLAHGQQTMTQVLEKSLNTGAVYVVQKLGKNLFRKYLEAFGFLAPTGVESAGEVAAQVKEIKNWSDVDLATMAFGQGIAVTTIQMLAAIGAIANDGKLLQPHLVDRILYPSGAVSIGPDVKGQVVSSQAAQLVSAMMVGVVERGHGTQAGVDGYYIAGKTGTAQVASPNGGYMSGVGSTIGTFVGFGPVENPRFVMITRIDHPKDVVYAESSAAPLFGDIAKFLLDYWRIAPTR
ncbi:MAG: penicillin-binding protein 2 [Patescibacteria group bacterium]